MLHSPASPIPLRSLVGAVALAASVVVACSGSGTETSSSTDPTSPTTTKGTSSGGDGSGACGSQTKPEEKRQPVYHCCFSINDGPEKTYDCPSVDAAKKCAPQGMPEMGGPPPMPDPSQCTLVKQDPKTWCEPPPSNGRCKFFQKTCKEASDCTDSNGAPMLGAWCNTAEHKCFDYMSTCVGERCNDAQDCGFMEQCDPCSHKCAKAE